MRQTQFPHPVVEHMLHSHRFPQVSARWLVLQSPPLLQLPCDSLSDQFGMQDTPCENQETPQ